MSALAFNPATLDGLSGFPVVVYAIGNVIYYGVPELRIAGTIIHACYPSPIITVGVAVLGATFRVQIFAVDAIRSFVVPMTGATFSWRRAPAIE